MKTIIIHKTRTFLSALAVAFALFAALLFAAPKVEANSGAGGKILNTIQIDYKDASGTTSYSANATTIVTVNLVKAGLTYSGRPTAGATGTSAAVPSNQTVNSGASPTYLIALTANANGGDTYNLSRTISTATNMASHSVTYIKVKNNGTTTVGSAGPATVAIGASVIQESGTGYIKIPGGSLAAAGLTGAAAADGRVLVIDGVDYLIDSVSAGNAPSNTHVGDTYYSNTGSATAEVLDTINLVANPSGANTAFTGSTVGNLAKEQLLILATVTGVVGSTPGTDGVVAFKLTTSDSSSGNSADTATFTTTYRGSNLQVKKTVKNITASGSYGATATGNPGDLLEYKVEINNAGSSSATVVTGTDAIPVYTKLVCGSGALGTAACSGTPTTAIIATIYDGTNTSLITYQSSDDECAGSPANVGAGDAAGFTEGSALHYYMGNGCNGITPSGGTVAASATYTIVYRVKME